MENNFFSNTICAEAAELCSRLVAAMLKIIPSDEGEENRARLRRLADKLVEVTVFHGTIDDEMISRARRIIEHRWGGYARIWSALAVTPTEAILPGHIRHTHQLLEGARVVLSGVEDPAAQQDLTRLAEIIEPHILAAIVHDADENDAIDAIDDRDRRFFVANAAFCVSYTSETDRMLLCIIRIAVRMQTLLAVPGRTSDLLHIKGLEANNVSNIGSAKPTDPIFRLVLVVAANLTERAVERGDLDENVPHAVDGYLNAGNFMASIVEDSAFLARFIAAATTDGDELVDSANRLLERAENLERERYAREDAFGGFPR